MEFLTNPVYRDLAEITLLAQDRKRWRGLALQIEKAAEVSQTKNWAGHDKCTMSGDLRACLSLRIPKNPFDLLAVLL